MTDLDLIVTAEMLGTVKSSKFLNGSLLLLLLLPPVLRTRGFLRVPCWGLVGASFFPSH